MGYNNARFHCLEHPNRIGREYCKECKSPICSSCVEEDPDFCPACRREFFLRSDNNVNQTDIFVTLIGGVLGFIGSYLFFQAQYPIDLWEEYGLHILYFTMFGFSAFFTFILYKDGIINDALDSVPFVNVKLIMIIYFASAASLVPAMIYLYKVVIYLATYRQRRL